MKKKIYYWSPCLNKVGTVISTKNSAISIAKYKKNEFKGVSIDTFSQISEGTKYHKGKRSNNKKHILVVDDDNRIRDLLKEYLTENNYTVSTSENAEDAKIKISYLKFDLIILDVMMPGQNGYELTKEIKKKIKVPIILLTAK